MTIMLKPRNNRINEAVDTYNRITYLIKTGVC